jgi:5-methylcytosine-specific restriction endonuclease McrA
MLFINRCKWCNDSTNPQSVYCSSVCKQDHEDSFKEPKSDLMLESLRLRDKYGPSWYTTTKWVEVKIKALKKYGHMCFKCKTTKEAMHVDHVISRHVLKQKRMYVSPYDITNLQILCATCNLAKGKRCEDYRPDNIKNSKWGDTPVVIKTKVNHTGRSQLRAWNEEMKATRERRKRANSNPGVITWAQVPNKPRC